MLTIKINMQKSIKNNYQTLIYAQVLLHTVTVSLVEELEGYS